MMDSSGLRPVGVVAGLGIALSVTPLSISAQQVSTTQLSQAVPIDGIAVLTDSVLLAASGYAGSRLHSIGVDGRVSTFADSLHGPIHVIIGPEGSVYASNFADSGTVVRIAADGSVKHFSVPQGPAGLALGPDRFVYVAIYGASSGTGTSVYRISPEDNVELFVEGHGIEAPIGLAFDGGGFLYVVNAKDGRVHRVTQDRQVSLFAQLPEGPGFFSSGHLVYSQRRFYASGNSSHVVYGIDMTGRVCTLAGSGVPGSHDGSGRAAQFTIPNGLAISPTGDRLYVVAGGGGFNDLFRTIALPELSRGPCGESAG